MKERTKDLIKDVATAVAVGVMLAYFISFTL